MDEIVKKRVPNNNKYYLALDKYDATGDISDMVEYVKQSIIQTWTVECRSLPSLSYMLEP